MWTLFWVFVCLFLFSHLWFEIEKDIINVEHVEPSSLWLTAGTNRNQKPHKFFKNYVRWLDYIVSESQRIKKQQQKAMAHRNTHTWVCPLTLRQCTSSDRETSNPYPIPEHLHKKIWKETSSLRTKSLTCINFKNAFQYTIGADKYYFIPLIRGT